MAKEPETEGADLPAATIIAELQKKLSRLRRKLKAARAELDGRKPPPQSLSPLAPRDGFPEVPAIDGVEFAIAEAGVKYSGRPDVMLARIAPGSTMAGVFTRSSTRSAPVLDCQRKLNRQSGGAGFAILVNSGNANAFTGAAGFSAVDRITGCVAQALDLPQAHVYSASTGVIGESLPDVRITDAIETLRQGLAPTGAKDAARAIMTTDTFAKGASSIVEIDGKPVKITGFAKGSGMIAPDMATMLVFLFTDARISQAALQNQVSRVNRRTFNCITVDGDTSTSDTLLVAATGKSGVGIGAGRSKSGRAFAQGLESVMRDLAHQVVRDGEGATKFLEVAVTGATTPAAARKVGMAIANSPLVKTAVAGEDPNWGRIVMAIGKSGARAERDRITIRFGEILVAENGWVAPGYLEQDGADYMRREYLKIGVDLGLGKGGATVWTCDLTKQYISINADYRS